MTNKIKTIWTSIPSHVTVVAVTKTFPFEAVATAHTMDLRHIGENRVEEARDKIQEAKRRGFIDLVWHMIGHVQRRKAREVTRLFDRVDSVDSIELLQKLDREAGDIHKKLHVLLEVNISGEQSKYGFDCTAWEKSSKKLKNFHISIYEKIQLRNVVIDGLMTMAPLVENPEENRNIYRSLKKLSIANPLIGRELSMGTSCDYQVAIEEGATQVRLGEALFGKRL